METTLDLPEALIRSARARAIAEHTSLAELIAALVSRELAEIRPEPAVDEDFAEWRRELL